MNRRKQSLSHIIVCIVIIILPLISSFKYSTLLISNRQILSAVMKRSSTTKSEITKESTEVTDVVGKKPKLDRPLYERDPIGNKPIINNDKYLKIISFNVAGLRAMIKNKSDVFAHFIQTESPDFLCLQVSQFILIFLC